MKYNQIQGFCPYCGKVPINQRIPNNLLHLLLTIASCGLWLIIWILILLLSTENWRCAKCYQKIILK